MIACQLSFYPLKTPAVNKKVAEVLQIIQTYSLDVKTNEMSTIVTGETAIVYDMLREITEKIQSEETQFVLSVTISNSCGWSAGGGNIG